MKFQGRDVEVTLAVTPPVHLPPYDSEGWRLDATTGTLWVRSLEALAHLVAQERQRKKECAAELQREPGGARGHLGQDTGT